MGGPSSGRRVAPEAKKPRYNRSPEARARQVARYKERRAEARNTGMCVRCLKRPVAKRTFWWKEGQDERIMRTCELCLEAEYWRARTKAIASSWCEECLAFAFHRSHCPNYNTSDSPMIARLDKKLLDLELSHMIEREKPVGLSLSTTTGQERGLGPLHPGIVEDGRPSDEGGPESSPDETDFPGLPRLKPPPSEAHVDEGKADRSLT